MRDNNRSAVKSAYTLQVVKPILRSTFLSSTACIDVKH